MSESKPKLTHKDAVVAISEVTSKADLAAITLHRCEVSQHRLDDDSENQKAGYLKVFEKTIGDGHYGCLVEFLDVNPFTGTSGDEDKPSEVPNGVKIRAGFETQFFIEDEEFSPEQIQAFLRASSVFQTWPYWREFLASMYGRLGRLESPILHPLPISEAIVLAGYEPVETNQSLAE